MSEAPPPMNEHGAQERVAIIVRLLMEGPQRAECMAERTGLKLRSVYYVLRNISREYPVTNYNGHWYLLSTDERRALYDILGKIDADLAQAKAGQAFGHSLKISEMAKLSAALRRFVCPPDPD